MPTYDLEVDFDMENDLDRHLDMWGFLVTETANPSRIKYSTGMSKLTNGVC